MEIIKAKGKKSVIFKTLERCWSTAKKSTSNPPNNCQRSLSKSKSCHGPSQVAPEGCFSVYVGPQKRRFVVKTECLNHPLFKMLLEEAEAVYGYNSKGPILLPCEVDLFYKVLAEMDPGDDDNIRTGCKFPLGYGSFSLLSPSRRPGLDCRGSQGYGGSYKLLSPPRMIKMN